MKKDQMIKLFGRIYTVSGENPTSKPDNNVETEKDPQSGVIELDSGNNREEDDDVAEQEQTTDEKTLKKPDKIIPCPRCNSMDTKFCYHNNYNVNQPRHFCKSCQRYWTSGGTMRNVPVGAGRRKNKNAAGCRHITVSEAISIQNGTVLSFGPESMKAPNEIPNGLFYRNGEIGDDCSSRSSVTTSNSIEDGFAKNGIIPPHPPQENFNGFHPHQIPYLSYPMPAFYQPMPGMPPFWNCSYPNSWTAIPWLSSPPPPPDYPPILGKHSREGDLIRPKSTNAGVKDLEGAILIPKTLRIDDPDEAAKSSIWTTLGINNDRRSLFKGFESKDDEHKKKKNDMVSPNLMANPAAMSRSVRLQEGA